MKSFLVDIDILTVDLKIAGWGGMQFRSLGALSMHHTDANSKVVCEFRPDVGKLSRQLIVLRTPPFKLPLNDGAYVFKLGLHICQLGSAIVRHARKCDQLFRASRRVLDSKELTHLGADGGQRPIVRGIEHHPTLECLDLTAQKPQPRRKGRRDDICALHFLLYSSPRLRGGEPDRSSQRPDGSDSTNPSSAITSPQRRNAEHLKAGERSDGDHKSEDHHAHDIQEFITH